VLEVPVNAVRVVGGQRGRSKIVEIEALESREVERRLGRKVRSSS
jgi:uncharacterized protein YggU (UPF0235/DUF167 family)